MSNPTPQRRLTRWIPWLALAALLAHIAEELPRFPAWATARFGTTSPEWFVISHIPVVGLASGIAATASRSLPSARSTWWLWVLIAALATNGLFHVGASLWFWEYGPGLVTAVVCYPALVLVAHRRMLPPPRSAWLAGAGIAAALTATLWLDIPI